MNVLSVSYKVIIKKTGTEYLLNKFKNNNINIRKINNDGNYLSFIAGESDLKLIIKICEKNKIDYEIEEIENLSSATRYIIKNKLFLILFLSALLLIFIYTNFMWNISINGNKYIESEDIVSLLDSLDIKAPIRKKGFDTNRLKGELHKRFSSLSFASIDMIGTNLVINITDHKNIESKMEINTPSNIIANKTAFIKKIIVTSGTTCIGEGEGVRRGEMIVSGDVVSDSGESIKKVRSKARIIGECNTKVKLSKEVLKESKYFTGNKHYEIVLFKDNKDITFLDYEGAYTNYIKREKRYDIFGNDIRLYVYEEYLKNETTTDYDMMLKEIKEEIKRNIRLTSKHIYSIEDMNIKYYMKDNILYAEGDIITLEDISREKEMW